MIKFYDAKADAQGHRFDVWARWLLLCPWITPDESEGLGSSGIDRPDIDMMLSMS